MRGAQFKKETNLITNLTLDDGSKGFVLGNISLHPKYWNLGDEHNVTKYMINAHFTIVVLSVTKKLKIVHLSILVHNGTKDLKIVHFSCTVHSETKDLKISLSSNVV